jgi:hypothetical protein
MTNAIPSSVFNNSDVRLRVWFNDGTHGSQLLSPDQRIASVGYAITSASAQSVAASGITGTLAVANGGTGATTPSGALADLGAAATSGNLTQFASTTSAQLASVISDETGSGSFVLNSSPTLSNPVINSNLTVNPLLFVFTDDSITNSPSTILLLRHDTVGAAAAGIGGAIDFQNENSAGATNVLTARIAGLLSNATSGTEVGQLSFLTRSAGATTSRLTLDSTGANFTVNVGVPVGSAGAPGLTFVGDNDTGLFHPTANSISLTTGGTEQLRVDSNGNVGIGTATPSERLHVVGDEMVVSDTNVNISLGFGAFRIRNTAGTAELQFDTNELLPIGTTVFAINGANQSETRINSTVFITTDSRVGIGDSTPDFRLQLPNVATDVGGRGRANAWVTYSSSRWKDNVAPIENALDKVMHLTGVMFDWKPEIGGTHDIGFVAEDVGRVVPELVTWETDRKLASGLKYDRITALLVEAVKSLEKENETLRTESTRAKSDSDKIKAQLTTLEDEIGSLRLRLEKGNNNSSDARNQ